MRRSMVFTMLVAGVVALSASSATARAANPGADGLIAFVDLHYHIAVVHPNGTGLTVLSHGSDQNPVWSPHGTKIAFEREVGPQALSRIYVMNADGSHQHQLFTGGGESSNDFSPSYSPNGKRVAFIRLPQTATGACRSHIMIGTVATGALRRIAHPVCDGDVRWSPTGGTLLFAHATRFGYGVYTYDLATGTKHLVAGGHAENADWSPDGRRIVYDQQTLAAGGPQASTNLFTVRADGSGRTRLTFFPPAAPELLDPSFGAIEPAYAPSGDAIVFFRHRPRQFDQLAIFSPANRSGAISYLPVRGAFLNLPSWQPLPTS